MSRHSEEGKAIAQATLDALDPLVQQTMSDLIHAAGGTEFWDKRLMALARRAVALERERNRLWRITR